MKKYLTMWQVWIGVSFVLAVLLIVGNGTNLASLLPLALLLVCPIMMLFMMGSHGHKEHDHGGRKGREGGEKNKVK